ncbi:MAG: hypothetical protein ACD_79C00304G0003 [uncultured bacterium]|nr:MAG: hypothetical protein ACD_79C00304G0003 [uncultured bacterium]
MKAKKNPQVLMKTSKGDIKILLYKDKSPVTVKNFLSYVNDEFYNGLIFHRVIKNFMIQGGGMDADLIEKENNEPIKNEAHNGLSNKRGTIAMARTSVVDSATSQFFINVADNVFLDYKGKHPSEYGYAVFGEVTEGMEVVDAIKAVKTGDQDEYSDVPLEPITIDSITEIA